LVAEKLEESNCRSNHILNLKLFCLFFFSPSYLNGSFLQESGNYVWLATEKTE